MNRREAREAAFKIIFAASFDSQGVDEAKNAFYSAEDLEREAGSLFEELLDSYCENKEAVDEKIKQNLRSWSFDRVSRVAISILRVAITELFFGSDNPEKVAINEAVELAKKYGDETDYKFVNGLLSSVIKGKDNEVT